MSDFSITPAGEDASAENAQFDTVRLQQMMQDIKSKQSLPMGILGGLIAAIVAAFIWAIVSYATGYQIGFMAIGVGFLVGYAVRFFGKGLSMTFGIAGALLALFGCLLGNLLMTIIAAVQGEGLPLSAVLSYLLTSPGVILEIMKDTFRPMDLLFYGIAVYEGYRFSFYELTEEEIASVRKINTPPPPIQTETAKQGE